MSTLYEIHRQITEIIKKTIKNKKVVLPVDYGALYTQIASRFDITLLDDECALKEKINEKIVRHIVTLADCTTEAIDAIKQHDTIALEKILDETAKLEAEIKELQKIIYEDDLTKSYNRKWFQDILVEQSTLSLRDNGTLVMIDLDKFKDINDTYGHVVGDNLLIHFALKLKELGGRVVRYGGDEFILIFGDKVTQHLIKTKMEELLAYCKKTAFKVKHGSFHIAFSYGIAPFIHGANVDDVIDMADKAMYRQKQK